MECPSCRLINPPSALRCDCGYDFQLRKVVSPGPPDGDKERRALKKKYGNHMAVGAAIAILGIFITAGTYLGAKPWERYWIMWGLIVVGLAEFAVGFSGWLKYRTPKW